MGNDMLDTGILDSIIIGRVEPHIYAFTTETVPNYLKVGDTYRPVAERIREWSSKYRNLRHIYTKSARINESTLFRDHAVHTFLEEEKGLHRLQPWEVERGVYYSREFFKDATSEDVDEAVADIHASANAKDGRYPLYTSDRLPMEAKYERGDSLTPRDMQQDAINEFVHAVGNGRDNLLMYAVMRFGKTFTSLCCAKEMEADKVLVLSAKKDVEEEWKKAVQGAGNFEGYVFANKRNLKTSRSFISDTFESGSKVVMFLTLQDLQSRQVKKVHTEVFDTIWDLVIVDETHFGARAVHYGEVLRNHKDRELKREHKEQLKEVDTLDAVDDAIKDLRRKVTLHLSGTPYRILMGGEFGKEDLVSFMQYTDIAEAKAEWDRVHVYDENVREWDNPYFGFPELLRFAFLPNKSSLDKIEELKNIHGAETSFSELFRTRDLSGKSDKSRMFSHEEAVLDLLLAIDGVKNDSNVLGFLDNERIRKGQMCRHMVMVLPYKASCDAMQELIRNNPEKFRHISGYEIVNISGHDAEKRFKDTETIKRHIRRCESEGKRTITLTVNKMLTGSTVPEWDTMLYLKSSSSPEEYDQAVFRLMNPYGKDYVNEEGRVVKFNMKPQVLLVDFEPDRLFRLQERKSQIYNYNTESNGNNRLFERIEKELKTSPVIVLDHNKLREVTASDVMAAVCDYSNARSVVDETMDLGVDMGLLENPEMRHIIESLEPVDPKKGLIFSSVKRAGKQTEGDDIGATMHGDSTGNGHDGQTESGKKAGAKESDVINKMRAFYARILLFAFLTEDEAKSLEDLMTLHEASDSNKRICRNIGLTREMLELMQRHLNPQALSTLDYKIQRINAIIRDESRSVMERVEIALKKLDRMSDSEIVTPAWVADNMVAMLPDDVIEQGPVLDIASKQGEFAAALVRRFGDKALTNVYSICTSNTAYEFTRRIYSLMKMPIENILNEFTSYDIIKKDNADILSRLKNMNLSTILGNPPYQEKGASGGSNDAPIYQDFCRASFTVSPKFTNMVIPTRWFTGGRRNLMDAFRENMLTSGHISRMTAFVDAKEVFPNAEIKGGCCYFLHDKSMRGKCKYTLVRKPNIVETERDLNDFEVFIREPLLADIVKKVYAPGLASLESIVSSDTPFGIPTNPDSNSKNSFDISLERDADHDTTLYLIRNGDRSIAFINKDDISKNKQDIDLPKVFLSAAYGAGETFPHQILGIPELAKSNSVCSQSYLYVAFQSESECRNFIKYIRSKFLRALVSASKISQHAMNRVYRFVPMQDFTSGGDIDWTQSVEGIDRQFYRKYGLTEDEVDFIESMIKPM